MLPYIIVLRMDSTVARLEREYCPPLDSALVSAILLDYDLTFEHAICQARATLDHVRAQAIVDEHTDFSPPGGCGNFGLPVAPESDGQSLEWPGSEETDLTRLSRSRSEPSWGPEDMDSGGLGSAEKDYTAGLDAQSKEAMFREMFPKLKPFTVENTLRKCQGNFWRTVDELLNRTFFEDETGEGEGRINLKGVDAFAEGSRRTGRNNKKGKRVRRRHESIEESASWSITTNEAAVISKWDTMKHDIHFIASRIHWTFNEVSSIYHTNGASLPATVRAILDGIGSPTRTTAEEPLIQQNAFELGQEFPTVPSTHVAAIVRLTHPSTSAAHELARELATTSHLNNPIGGIQIIHRFPTIETSFSQFPTVQHTPDQSPNVSVPNAAALASSNSFKRDTAFAQASAAYRKGKSDPFMAAAAGYYSDLGRDHDAAARAYSAAAADALVEAQSTDNILDLHGVSVKDAVRIAKEKVRMWWVGLGEQSIRGRVGVSLGYKIVTGVGRHSEGGKGKIGPAVAKALIREKWKVEMGDGVVIVTGVRRS